MKSPRPTLLPLLVAMSLGGACAKAPSPSTNTTPTTIDASEPEADAQTDVQAQAKGSSLALSGPYTNLTEMCSEYKKTALSSFDVETLERWKKHGTEKYATAPKSYVPVPTCDEEEAEADRNLMTSGEYTILTVYDGNPNARGASSLLALKTDAGWYYQTAAQKVPWLTSEVDGPHLGRRNVWTPGTGKDLAWTISVEHRFAGHPTANCSSGASGSKQVITLSCEVVEGRPDCRYETGDVESWESPRRCH